MSGNLFIDIQDAELQRALQTAALRLDNLSPLMADVASQLEQNVNLRLDAGVGADGNPLAPRSEVTIALYQRRFGTVPGKVLQLTGRMAQSLSSGSGRDFAEVGFATDYAGYHVTGTKKMPRRDVLTANPLTGLLGEDDRQDILALTLQYIDGALG
jgi:phage virion morphogenesis protein